MNLLSRNFIIFYLVVCILGAFSFHWFFVEKMMPVSECFSADCSYVSSKTILRETMNILLITLIVIFLAVIQFLTISPDNKFRKMPGRMFLEWKIVGVFRKLISWLKILEKRDPQTALIAVRISDFRQ